MRTVKHKADKSTDGTEGEIEKPEFTVFKGVTPFVRLTDATDLSQQIQCFIPRCFEHQINRS
jgi:hypothetical protein